MKTESAEWEYEDFVYKWPPKQGGWVCLSDWGAYTIPTARLHFWQKYQHDIMPKLQEWLDAGWEPVGEVGPGAIRLRSYKSLTQGSDPIEFILKSWLVVVTLGLAYFGLRDHFVEPAEFRVTTRRKKPSQAE